MTRTQGGFVYARIRVCVKSVDRLLACNREESAVRSAAMTKPRIIRSTLAVTILAAMLAVPGQGYADEVTLIAPGGIRAAIEKMIPAFEKQTGHKVKATFGSGVGTKQQVIKGEAFDVPVVQPPVMPVIDSGHAKIISHQPEQHLALRKTVQRRNGEQFTPASAAL